jgi:hypothetical protein
LIRENEKRSASRIFLQELSEQGMQTIKALAQIERVQRDEDPEAPRKTSIEPAPKFVKARPRSALGPDFQLPTWLPKATARPNQVPALESQHRALPPQPFRTIGRLSPVPGESQPQRGKRRPFACDATSQQTFDT